jgi:hypothetical protein
MHDLRGRCQTALCRQICGIATSPVDKPKITINFQLWNSQSRKTCLPCIVCYATYWKCKTLSILNSEGRRIAQIVPAKVSNLTTS